MITGYNFCKSEIDVRFKKLYGRFFVYILKSKRKYVYIGCSSSIYYRLIQHKGTKNFDRVELFEFKNKNDSKITEKSFIKKYKPADNIQYLYR